MSRNRLAKQFAVVCVLSLLITGAICLAVTYSTPESTQTWWFQRLVGPIQMLAVETWACSSLLLPGSDSSGGSPDIHNVPNGIGVYFALFLINVVTGSIMLGGINCFCFTRRNR